ncbi:MAG: hypothetical protein ACK4K0_03835 [Flavobacteriales bacterium]
MKQKQSYKYILVGLLLTVFNVVFAQQFKSEQERIKYADKLFEEKKFIEAEAHYLQILSLNRTSSEYNFKYGTCLLFSDADKEKCLNYLRFASKQADVDIRVFYYIGRAFHVNYMFNDAIKAYEDFKKKADAKMQKDLQVDQYISMCKNGKRLLSNISELVVLDRKEVKEDKFMYSYDLSNIGGKILITTEFQTKYDQKMGHRAVVHFPANQEDVIFFSSYGKDGVTGLDLYRIRRLPDGSWSDPQRLPDNINTPYDDDFAFLHPDGRTFYFSSKGHNTMGGYDIFKSTYNKETNTFTRPENLDFKINTPSDDFLYVADSLNKEAFFASNRANKGGYYNVYNVRVEVISVMNVILAGNFKNEIDKLTKNATIKIRDPIRDVEVGVFNSSAQNGDYIIILPKGGKYEFIVEVKGSKTHTAVVDIPLQKEIKPLKQEILLVKQNNEEKLIIRNLFDQEVDNASEIISQAMKIIANPDVNTDQFPDVKEPVSQDIDVNVSDAELVSMAEKWAAEAKEEAEKTAEKKEQAYKVAADKLSEAEELLNGAKSKLTEVEKTKDEKEKLILLKEAEELLEVASIEKNQAKTAVSLAIELEKTAIIKAEEAKKSAQYAQGIKSAVQSKSPEQAVKQLREMQNFVNTITDVDVNKGNTYDEAREKAVLAQKEADKAMIKANSIREEQGDLRKDNTRLQNELKSAKKKDEKEKIQQKLDNNNRLIKDLDNDSKQAYTRYEELQRTASKLEKEAELLGDMYNKIEFTDSKGTPLTNQQKENIKSKVNQTEIDQNIAQTSARVQSEKNKTQELLAQKTLDTNPTNGAISSEATRYKTFEEELASSSGLSGDEKLKKQNEINQSWISKIDSDLKEIDRRITKEKNAFKKEELEMERESLAALKSEKQQAIKANQETLAANSGTSTSASTTSKESLIIKEEEAISAGNTAEAYLARKSYNEQLTEEKAELENKLKTSKGKEAKEVKKQLDELNDEIKTSADKESQLKQQTIEQALAETNTESKLNEARVISSSVKPTNESEAKRQNQAIDKIDNELANKEIELVNALRTKGIDPTSDKEVEAELAELAAVRDRLNQRKLQNEEVTGRVASTEPVNNESKTTNPIVADAKLNQMQSDWEKTQSTNPTSTEAYTKRIEQSENYIEALDDKIGLTQAALNNTTNQADRNDLQNQLEQLNTERKSITQAIEKDKNAKTQLESQLASATKTPEVKLNETAKSSASIPVEELRSPNAKRIAETASRENKKIEDLVAKKMQLEESVSATTDEKLRKKDEKELEKINQQLNTTQINKSNQLSKAHEEEYKTLNAENKNLRSPEISIEELSKIDELSEKSNDNFNESRALRNDANSIKNPEDKAKKLEEANQKEVLAIRQMQESNELVRNADKSLSQPLATTTSKSQQFDEVAKNYKASNISEFEVTTSLTDIKPSNLNAANELTSQQKNINQIKQSEEKIEELAAQLENQSNPKNQQKIAKQIEAEEKKKATKEIQVNPAYEKANAIELASAQRGNQNKKEAVRASGISDGEDLSIARRHEQLAQNKLNEAIKLREESKKEKDPVTKSEKLRSAIAAEQSAIKHLQEADKIYGRLLDEYVVLLSRSKDAGDKPLSSESIRSKATAFDAKADDLQEQADASRDSLPKAPKNQLNERTQRISDLEDAAKSNRVLASNMRLAAKNKEADEELNVVSNSAISEQEALIIRTLPEYDIIYQKQVEIDKIEKDIESKQNEQIRRAKEIEKNELLASQSRSAAQATRDKNERAELNTKANEYEAKAEELKSTYDKFDLDIQLTMEQRKALMKERNQLVNSVEERNKAKVAALLMSNMDKIPVKAPVVIPTENILASNFTPPSVLTQQIFATTERPVYNDSNPIPINPETPKGLFYKVQVGAFRRPVPNETFKEFAPVSAEQINDGLIRYQVGYFTEFGVANNAKNQVRGIGYSDAFVVAFYEGKRITLAEARRIAEGQEPAIAANSTISPIITTPTNNQNTGAITTTTTPSTPNQVKQLTSYYDAVPNAAKANQVEVIQGLFYTVQVGVYSKPVTAEQLFDLSPLNSELTQNQLVRYTTGTFINVPDAAQRRDAIREIGIADAFVVAYYNGKKITTAEANRLLQENGSSILAVDADGSLRKITTTPTYPSVNNTTIVPVVPTPIPAADIKYAVDLGEYEGNVPGNIANVFITNPEITVNSEKITDTRSRYTTKQYNTRVEAERAVQIFQSKGVAGAKLIYFKSGTEVSEEEAMRTGDESKSTTPKYSNIIYRVYLGEYGDNVPGNVSMAMIEMQSEGIEPVKKASGRTAYLAGKYKTEEEANNIRRKFADAGIGSAVVKAYSESNEISLEEARQSKNN